MIRPLRLSDHTRITLECVVEADKFYSKIVIRACFFLLCVIYHKSHAAIVAEAIRLWVSAMICVRNAIRDDGAVTFFFCPRKRSIKSMPQLIIGHPVVFPFGYEPEPLALLQT